GAIRRTLGGLRNPHQALPGRRVEHRARQSLNRGVTRSFTGSEGGPLLAAVSQGAGAALFTVRGSSASMTQWFGKFEVNLDSDLILHRFSVELKRLVPPVLHRVHGGWGKLRRAFDNLHIV